MRNFPQLAKLIRVNALCPYFGDLPPTGLGAGKDRATSYVSTSVGSLVMGVDTSGGHIGAVGPLRTLRINKKPITNTPRDLLIVRGPRRVGIPIQRTPPTRRATERPQRGDRPARRGPADFFGRQCCDSPLALRIGGFADTEYPRMSGGGRQFRNSDIGRVCG